MALDAEPTSTPIEVPSGGEMIPSRDAKGPAMSIDDLNAKLDDDALSGIHDVADYDPSVFEDFVPPAEAPPAPDAATAGPDIAAKTTADAESADVAAAKARLLTGESGIGSADAKLVERHNSDLKKGKDLQAAREAHVNGEELSEAQQQLLKEDSEKRGAERVANKKAEIDELKAKQKTDGKFDDEADQVKYDAHMAVKARTEKLMERAAAGDTLTDDEIDAMEEGKKVFDLESDEDEAVSETEEAKLTRIQGEIEATTTAMLNEKDPEKRAEMLTNIAAQQAELMGMQMDASAKERDARVIKEAFTGKREGKSLFGSNEKRSARNERVQKLIDSMLADAAELQAVAQRMQAIDIARKKIIEKVNSEKIRLGHRSTPMDKFVQVREVAPYYRQLLDLDDRMADAKDAEYTFASRFYKNIRSIRAAVKARGVMMRIAESVALTALKYNADSAKYTRRVARAVTLQ